ncbi:beta-galactosidase GanA [Pseudoxanthomonas sacheonensis]|uniref:Beta-galactosidase GanA n=2 Tax=Pseudoxanthomonas sacheonensis TaxID=443615 RepID=A0ABU1RTK8_9GAMM|nr:beta-galactosidase GanA [Pseudoxanthomonas sacheonensis]
MRRRGAVWLAATLSLLLGMAAHAATREMPRYVSENGRHALFVDGAPYSIMAAQLHNSSAWPQVLPQALDQVEALHANTVEAPVYWEQFEPEPGRYDYTNIDALIAQARTRGLRLALLWFGTWKNGQMHYVPDWIKRDRATYPRMLDANGVPVDVLSPHAQTNRDVDSRAFAALMRHLRKVDEGTYTVILVQVQNEPGAIGTVRDHGEAGERAFREQVPEAVARALSKPAGTWTEVFGPGAAEAFSAYANAVYIEQVAAAGKAEYPLPLYVNTWLRYKGKIHPGLDYPSGGATWNVFDLWRVVTPSIDFIGTDIYTSDYNEYTKVVDQYARPDNPAWVSETGFEAATAPYHFYVLGKGGLGFSVFGIDGNEDTPENRAATEAYAAAFGLLTPMQRMLASAAFEGRLQAAVEKPGTPQQDLRFGPWQARVSFGAPMWGDAPAILPGTPDHAGRVLVVQLEPEVFLVTGFQGRVEFQRDTTDGKYGQLLKVEQGRYVDGKWRTVRWLNGDETDYGLNFRVRDPYVLKVTVGTH